MSDNVGKPYRQRVGFAGLMGAIVLAVGAKAATGHGTQQPAALVALPGVTGSTQQPSPSGAPSSPAAGSSGSGGSGSSSATTTATRTVTGDAISTRYGDVQVQVILRGTRITDVVAVALPDQERRDLEINNAAVPILRQEVLDAQSARIDSVSGASYTSSGYASSVQSALDKA